MSEMVHKTPMNWLSLFWLAAWTALADWLIYRTLGYAGPAVFAAIMPVFLLLPRSTVVDSRPSSRSLVSLICALLLLCTSLRLAFGGNGFVVLSAAMLFFAMALSQSNAIPWAFDVIAMPFRAAIDGVIWIYSHRLPAIQRRGDPLTVGGNAWTWLLPLLATLVFGACFVFANPDLYETVATHWNWLSTIVGQWCQRLDAWEIPFCVIALLLGAGALFPYFGRMRIGGVDADVLPSEASNAPLHAAFRNTLLCLIVLFSVYLVFEFKTLFKRDFPVGFYYAGYAHQGAAWLTAALALATSLLSLIFRGPTLTDSRIGQLKMLAWVWSLTNFLLAIAVYNRLGIYVGYNGLTVMRIVGFFGTTVVVVGFFLVLIKIRSEKGFWWLLRTQTTALLLFMIAFTLFPVDYVAHWYNAHRIHQGQLEPAVMIAVKRKDDSGYLPMIDLVDCPDEKIREGVRAMLAERQIDIEQRTAETPWHWTRYQASTALLYRKMVANESAWQRYLDDPTARNLQLQRFEDYAMQWY